MAIAFKTHQRPHFWLPQISNVEIRVPDPAWLFSACRFSPDRLSANPKRRVGHFITFIPARLAWRRGRWRAGGKWWKRRSNKSCRSCLRKTMIITPLELLNLYFSDGQPTGNRESKLWQRFNDLLTWDAILNKGYQSDLCPQRFKDQFDSGTDGGKL